MAASTRQREGEEVASASAAARHDKSLTMRTLLMSCLSILCNLMTSFLSVIQAASQKLVGFSHQLAQLVVVPPLLLVPVDLSVDDDEDIVSHAPPGRTISSDTSSTCNEDDDDDDDDEETEDWWTRTIRRLQENDPELYELDLDASMMYEEQHRNGDGHEVSLQEDVQDLVDALQDNTVVTHLSLRNLTINSPSHILALAKAIPQITFLQLEDTRGAGLETVAKILLSAANTTTTTTTTTTSKTIMGRLQHPAAPSGVLPSPTPTVTPPLLSHLLELRLNHAHISIPVAKMLAQALASPSASIQRLDLQGSHLNDSTMIPLCRAMARNASVQYWCLDFNSFRDTGARALGFMLQRNKKLQELHLFGNNITTVGAEHLAAALPYNTTLQSLVLSLNDMGDAGVAAFSRALVHNTSLKKLWVPSNQVGNAGLYAVAQYLPHWQGLEELNLGDYFDTHAAAAIRTSLQHNYVLKRLYLESPVYDCEQTEREIDFYLRLNQCGRKPWLCDESMLLPASLQPHALVKTHGYTSAMGSPDVLFYLLQHQPNMCEQPSHNHCPSRPTSVIHDPRETDDDE
ncbi:Leucine-rich repeat protein [Seminavis robusta]|uniref:Leucine-rich repeat protein n=1 Tax=Seminavis robusta TaxID=568900 RepID=A0A9N8DUS8_9STRA|nr:Leucine-rich repeat protein [Seminavis robusta]|eukprot:Sro297_g110890.1 Leucine-rich repeat protein (573) ;mRNA; f:38117-39835